eukprot:gene27898-36749_t
MAPPSIGLLFLGLVLTVMSHGERWREEVAWARQLSALWPLLLSCVLAVGLNLSFFVVLGHFEPVTLSMFREVKTVMVVVCGFAISGT